MESGSSSSSEDVQMEDMEVMNFLLRSKLACHEDTYEKQEQALCYEKEEKKVLQQTVNDLISIAAEANMTIAAEPDVSINVESDFSEEIGNLQHELEEKNNAIGTLRSRLADLQQKVTVEDQQKEVLEEMNCQIFLLRSKLSSHETSFDELKKELARYEQALCHEKEEKTVLQQTANDLIPNAAEAENNCVDATIQLGVWSKKLTFCKRAIFQIFWRLHCCTKFLFFELETLNFGFSYVFSSPLKCRGQFLPNLIF